MEIIIRIIGVLVIILGVISFQCKKHFHIMVVRAGIEALLCLQYFFLNATLGLLIGILGIVRNLTFAFVNKKNGNALPFQILFSVLVVIINAFFWDGWMSLVVCFSKIVTTMSYGLKNVKTLKKISLFSCSSWAIYNYAVGSYEGMINDVMEVISIIVFFIRIAIENKKAKSEKDDSPSLEKSEKTE